MYKKGPQPSVVVPNLTVTKKVRMDKATAGRLRHLAQALKMTESRVIREALHRYEVLQNREAAIQKLRELFPGPEPPKERHRFQ